MVGSGVAPFVEPQLGELLSSAFEAGRLRATLDIEDAVRSTEGMILCVGTPTAEDETPDLRYLTQASSQIGAALKGTTKPYTVLMRSTVPPGTIQDVVIPAIEKAAHRLVGEEDGIRVLAVPEFLREGSAIADFDDPPFVAVGGPMPASQRDLDLIADLFPFPERIRYVEYRLAELLKVVCNAYHAAKTVFGNEVGQLCTSLGIDGVKLMALLCEDRKLNSSGAYLRPGGPFGGSCLPKDLRALVYLSNKTGNPSLQLRATLESNYRHIDSYVEKIDAMGVKRVGIDGLAFKNGTDDLRESPTVAIAEALLEKGYDVKIYDPAVARGKAHDKSKAPLLARLVESQQDLLRHSEVIVQRGASPSLLQLAAAMGATPILLELGKPAYRFGVPASEAMVEPRARGSAIEEAVIAS
jgi:GDP-mannose 6-dehydrogenase